MTLAGTVSPVGEHKVWTQGLHHTCKYHSHAPSHMSPEFPLQISHTLQQLKSTRTHSSQTYL